MTHTIWPTAFPLYFFHTLRSQSGIRRMVIVAWFERIHSIECDILSVSAWIDRNGKKQECSDMVACLSALWIIWNSLFSSWQKAIVVKINIVIFGRIAQGLYNFTDHRRSLLLFVLTSTLCDMRWCPNRHDHLFVYFIFFLSPSPLPTLPLPLSLSHPISLALLSVSYFMYLYTMFSFDCFFCKFGQCWRSMAIVSIANDGVQEFI